MAIRYFNKVTKTEAIEGFHNIDPPDVVSLDESNVFFVELPDGYQITYDVNGVPDGTELIPVIPLTALESAVADIIALGYTRESVFTAMYQSTVNLDNTDAAAIKVDVDNAASVWGVTSGEIILSLFGSL